MKQKNVIKAVCSGDVTNRAFITVWRIQMLSALKKRGILTEEEFQRGLVLLKEPVR